MGSPASTLSTDLAGTIRTNTFLLAAGMALSWSVVQLAAGLSAVTLATLTGSAAFGGIAPAVLLLSWAGASLLMGRFMDLKGRVPGLRLGFLAGILGSLIVFAGISGGAAAVFLVGLARVGGAAGTVNLSRIGAADMYPPERRARGISYVLVGAALGAILSPFAFAPLLAQAAGGAQALASPWLIAAGLFGVGALITLGIRVDPVTIARQRTASAQPVAAAPAPARSLGTLLVLPGVPVALTAAVVAQAVMNGLMTIMGLAMVGHGHHLPAVAFSMSAHFLGMFGLVLVVGQLVDRLGRQQALVLGLAGLAAGALALLASGSLEAILVGMFAVGVGWNLAFVASTAVLADAATPAERARLLGFNDFAAMGMGALAAATGGLLLGLAGLTYLIVPAAALALLRIVLLLLRRQVVPAASSA